jgi:hypothetical protein
MESQESHGWSLRSAKTNRRMICWQSEMNGPDIVDAILNGRHPSNTCKIDAGRSSPMERGFNEVDAASTKQAVGSVNDFCPGP